MAVYNNGVVKKKCLRNLQVDEVATIVEDLSYGSGVKAKKAYSPVIRAGVAKEDVLQTWNPITSELSFKP